LEIDSLDGGDSDDLGQSGAAETGALDATDTGELQESSAARVKWYKVDVAKEKKKKTADSSSKM